MELSMMHAGIAAGVGLAALPVILHLFMRQTPKHVIFPALRLVKERQKRSKKRMRIKNWLLLLARMQALVPLMALKARLCGPRFIERPPWDLNRSRRRWASFSTPAFRWAISKRTRPGLTRPRNVPARS